MFLEHIHYVIYIVIFHNVVLFFVGFYFAKINKLSFVNQKTLSIETGIQNAGLGIIAGLFFFSMDWEEWLYWLHFGQFGIFFQEW